MMEYKLQADSTCFVDTNIWLYAFIEAQDKEKTKIAQSIISKNDIIISTQVINEMSINLFKKGGFSEVQIRSLYSPYTKNIQFLN